MSNENNKLVKLVEDLRKEAELLREDAEKHLKEKQFSEAEIKQMNEELSRLKEANEEMRRLRIKEQEITEEYKMQITVLSQEADEKKGALSRKESYARKYC